MHVKVRLFATLRRYMTESRERNPLDMDLPEGATLRNLLDLLHVPPEEARVSFVNGIIHELDWELKEGDEVGMFPPIGGG